MIAPGRAGVGWRLTGDDAWLGTLGPTERAAAVARGEQWLDAIREDLIHGVPSMDEVMVRLGLPSLTEHRVRQAEMHARGVLTADDWARDPIPAFVFELVAHDGDEDAAVAALGPA